MKEPAGFRLPFYWLELVPDRERVQMGGSYPWAVNPNGLRAASITEAYPVRRNGVPLVARIRGRATQYSCRLDWLPADGSDRREWKQHPPDCKGCGIGPLPSSVRRWCNECSTAANIRCVPGTARHYVEKRDDGVCQGCGFDTHLVGMWVRDLKLRRCRGRRGLVAKAQQEILRQLEGAKVLQLQGYSMVTWEMEHVLPVSDGGGLCSLENLTTLCLRCHKDSTAGLAHRRARERSGQKQLALV